MTLRLDAVGSFNPCFGGSYIVTSILGSDDLHTFMFQSLFWWILYCDEVDDIDGKNAEMFQSLFWWILYCDNLQPSLIWARRLCFNPCFGGSYIVTHCFVWGFVRR